MGDRVQDVAITSDSKWAVVCAFETGTVKIVDLETNTVVADVPCGSRAGVVALAPDDSHAYVGNISSNTISVVELDGADSSEVAEIPCGIIGVVWAAYGVSSDVVCSPDGDEVLVAASFDDQVKVIDTVSNSVVASLTVGDFPIQIAFDGTGDYAVVTNYFDDSYSILRIDGAASSVVGTFDCGDAPLRLALNPVSGLVGVGAYGAKTVYLVDPSTGEAVTPVPGVSFFAYGTLKYGVNVACGDLDRDGFDEIVTGPGPGVIFGPHVRGWNVDGGTAVAMGGVNFIAYPGALYGVRVSAGNLAYDAFDEILTTLGPGSPPGYSCLVRGWNVVGGGGSTELIPGIDFEAYDGYVTHGGNATAVR